MANLRNIQFLRNATVYNSLEAAKDALTTKAATALDGSAILGRYTVQTGDTTGDTEVRSIMALVYNGTASFLFNEKEISSALDGLDFGPVGYTSASVVNGVGQADGKLSAETVNVGTLLLTGYDEGSESGKVASTDSINAGIAKLQNQIDAANDVIGSLDANSVSGDSKVVIDVTQEDGQITATAANLTSVKLDGYQEANAVANVADTDTLGQALGKLQKTIHEMDKAADAVAGQVVTTVSEDDGVVSETKANVKDLQLGGYAKTNDTGDIASADTINVALSKLENKSNAITIDNEDGSINVTTAATGTDINVNIKSGERVIKLDANGDGIYTNINLVKITESLPAEIKERYELRDSDNVKIGDSIDVPKDSHIVSISYITTGEHAQNLEYVYLDVSGNTQTTYVDMSSLVIEAEFASGVTAIDHVVRGVVDPTSEKDSNNVSFLTVGADGFKVDGIKDEIDTKIAVLDFTTDAAVAGQYVAAIEETDGIVAVKTRENVSEAVLNNYTKGSDASAVTATDTVNQAISKLENQVDAAKAAATTKVVEGTDAGNNMTIVPATGADESVTYTINLVDVASASALTAEITARKAVDGQNGDTYAANTSAKYISGASSLNDADVKLDAALYELSGKTFTEAGSANNSITFTENTAADGTTHIDAQTDASKISGLTPVTSVADEITGVTADSSVQTGIKNLYDSLAAEIAARKAAISATTVSSGNAGIVATPNASGTTVTLTLSQSNDNGRLTIENDGLKLSNVYDCGTFDED